MEFSHPICTSVFIHDPSTSLWQPEPCLTRISNIWKASVNFQLFLIQLTSGNMQRSQFKRDHQQVLPTRISGLLTQWSQPPQTEQAAAGWWALPKTTFPWISILPRVTSTKSPSAMAYGTAVEDTVLGLKITLWLLQAVTHWSLGHWARFCSGWITISIVWFKAKILC